ncbi:MAG: hypothetical protein ACLP1X_29800 [Polyangiaceae bacterium]
MASVIVGEWTHRRGDSGGARTVSAEIDKPRPSVAWSWSPDHGGRVDQVRVVGSTVVVATMMPRDSSAPGWEHAIIYVLDALSGVEIARRVLPDPVPVAAMAFDGGTIHVVATRRGEPVFWYALSPMELAPRHRRVVGIGDDLRHEDVLDAWATPDGGLWLELDATLGPEGARAHTYSFVDPDGGPAVTRLNDEHAAAANPPLARDACAGGHELFVPLDGRWSGEVDASPPLLSRLEPRLPVQGVGRSWARADLVGPRAQIHALASEGVVCALAAAEDPAKPDRVRVEAFAADRTTGAVLWRAQHDRIAVRSQLGDAARVARRPNGELLFQSLDAEGVPCTPLVCASSDGRLDEILLGARGPFVLDAALGDLVLAHRENREGHVEVGGFAIDHEGRLLGRRAVASWTIDAGDLGGGATVYAGAGSVVVRGARSVCTVRL